jgi:predicted ArsR family transcriptional regulator
MAESSLQRPERVHLAVLELPFERDLFLRTLLRHLAGTLEEVVGQKEASGFVAIVGQRIGEEIDTMYRKAIAVERLDAEQVAEVCVDLKRRIQGDFYVVEQTEERIVFGNRACPFGEKVLGRPSLCMMTSNVFGTIAAENLGYGKVVLEETIAQGSSTCRVVIYLRPSARAEESPGREYVRGT